MGVCHCFIFPKKDICLGQTDHLSPGDISYIHILPPMYSNLQNTTGTYNFTMQYIYILLDPIQQKQDI